MAGESRSWAARAFDDSSRHTKRAVVGGSSMTVTVLATWLSHDVLGLEMPPEVFVAIASVFYGAIGWAFSGGLEDTVALFVKLRRQWREG